MGRDIRYFFQLSRPLNVLISLLAFALGSYLALDSSFSFVQDPAFWATTLSIAIIAATGYWINDVYDYRIDRINKSDKPLINAYLSVKKVLTFYFITCAGLLFASLIYLGWVEKHYAVSFINFVAVFLLFAYAAWLKRTGLPGNLAISFLISLVILIAGYLYKVNLPLVWASIFAFEITLIREIVKDAEDIRGDLQFGVRTLPIQIGLQRSKTVLSILYLLFLLSTWLPFLLHYFRGGEWLYTYALPSVILVQIPTAYLLGSLQKAETQKDFAMQSTGLKLLMLTGMGTLLFLG